MRLAQNEEVAACQKLRYRVFYQERGAIPVGDMAKLERDIDDFDEICDHLVVLRQGSPRGEDPLLLRDGELIGTYRLLRQDVADNHDGYYTEAEFDISPIVKAHPDLRFLELGRSCVLREFRTKPVIELLWQGIWNYVRAYRMDVMFGCASLEGTDPEQHAQSLSLLSQAMAPPEWHVRALTSHRIEMNRPAAVMTDQRQALKSLPPLIKGYLRLGCYIGDGAVIDRQFNTIDVLIILPVSRINTRYFAHFGAPSG